MNTDFTHTNGTIHAWYACRKILSRFHIRHSSNFASFRGNVFKLRSNERARNKKILDGGLFATLFIGLQFLSEIT